MDYTNNMNQYIFLNAILKADIEDNKIIIFKHDYILDIFLSNNHYKIYYNFCTKLLIINIIGIDPDAENVCKQARIKYNYLQVYVITVNNLLDGLNVKIIHPKYIEKFIENYENQNEKIVIPKKSWFNYLYSFIN